MVLEKASIGKINYCCCPLTVNCLFRASVDTNSTAAHRLTDGGDEGGVEGVLAEPEQEAGFADAAVTDQQQLEQIVVRLGHVPAACPGSPGTETEVSASSPSAGNTGSSSSVSLRAGIH